MTFSKVKYKKGEHLYLADTLSRAFPEDSAEVDPRLSEICLQIEEIDLEEEVNLEPDVLKSIKDATLPDPESQALSELLQKGWPESRDQVPETAKPYYTYRQTLSLQNGLLYKDDRVVIPKSLRSAMMKRLHSTHLGMEGCLRRARESFFWPGMNAQIRDNIGSCGICNSLRPEQCREPLMPSETPERPWSKVAIDLFTFDAVDHVIIADYYSNYFEVDVLKNTVAISVIHKLKGQFARHGIPDVVVSDNGPQFANAEYRSFAKEWGFQLITSSPRYPQSNGKAENAVKTCKEIMKKCKKSKADTYLALLDLRSTPSEALGSSPAQLLFGRRLRTRLPMKSTQLQPEIADPAAVQSRIDDAKEKQSKYYNRKSKPLVPLKEGDKVRMKRPGEAEWSPAICKKRLDKRSYLVKSRVFTAATVVKSAVRLKRILLKFRLKFRYHVLHRKRCPVHQK
eukprot:m.250166 g.250166  ORF g.250166 m.250166 type:complete len:454 (+) comp40312_c0_seq1:2745-4106(+)